MNKSRGTKWDGKSRVSNDLYRKRYDEIFKKEQDPFKKKVKEEPISDEELKEIDKRNGF